MLDISAHARQARSEFWYKKFELNWSFIEKYSVKKSEMEKVRGCYMVTVSPYDLWFIMLYWSLWLNEMKDQMNREKEGKG